MLWMVAKSCTSWKMENIPLKSHEIYRRFIYDKNSNSFQLVDFATIQSHGISPACLAAWHFLGRLRGLHVEGRGACGSEAEIVWVQKSRGSPTWTMKKIMAMRVRDSLSSGYIVDQIHVDVTKQHDTTYHSNLGFELIWTKQTWTLTTELEPVARTCCSAIFHQQKVWLLITQANRWCCRDTHQTHLPGRYVWKWWVGTKQAIFSAFALTFKIFSSWLVFFPVLCMHTLLLVCLCSYLLIKLQQSYWRPYATAYIDLLVLCLSAGSNPKSFSLSLFTFIYIYMFM